MRVIAGTYRSRLLAAPKGTGTRPTSDRLRETLFNILATRVPNSRFADLYAGTGAVGIEALSRGAKQVWFAEKAEPARAAIRANLKALKISQGFAIEERGTGALLERLAKAASSRAGQREDHAKPGESHEVTAARAGRPSGATILKSGDLLDLVYLDPPWEAEAEYDKTLHLLGSLRGQALLAPAAWIVAEHSSKSPLAERYGNLVQTRTLKQGDAALTLYARAPEQAG